MMSETYCGWTNYETWAFALWLDNDRPAYEFYTELAKEYYQTAKADNTFSKVENAAFKLSEQLQTDLEDSVPDMPYGFWSDVAGAVTRSVNTHEIAMHWIRDAAYELEEVA